MTVALLDHLWQSTLFALMAGLATLSFRNNGAEVRYGLWFAASMKFLLPFALLTMIGRALLIPVHPDPSLSPLFCDVQPAIQPFLTTAEMATSDVSKGLRLGPVLASIWALGFAAVLAIWTARWFSLRKIVRLARDANIPAPVPVKYGPGFLEPGLVGIFRPVLLLPEGISARLSPAEMRAVMAHELCHLRRRDNLMAALHMIVEAVFWFHPLIWWLGARLVEERERACDQAVLRAGADPEIYAQGILKICRFYLRSPLPSASGVSGADLKKRVSAIMREGVASRLNFVRKASLGAAMLVTISVPLAAGLIEARLASAQASQAPNAAAQGLPFNPRLFDRYAGDYRLPDGAILHVTRDGGRYFVQESSRQLVEIFPQTESTFLAKTVPVATQVSFDLDSAGMAAQAVVRRGGREYDAKRIGERHGASHGETAPRLPDDGRRQGP